MNKKIYQKNTPLYRMNRAIFILILGFSLAFIVGCNTKNQHIDLKGIKLNTKQKIEDKVMTINGKYFLFNTRNLNNGRVAIITAKAIKHKNDEDFRFVTYSEVDDLIISIQNKYGVELVPFGGLNVSEGSHYNVPDGSYYPGGYKAIKDDVEYRINGINSSYGSNAFKGFKSLFVVIKDLKLGEILDKERKEKFEKRKDDI
ncbi:MAG: hypothetical protein QM478_03270 [Flavobacteriaceae bacterium]